MFKQEFARTLCTFKQKFARTPCTFKQKFLHTLCTFKAYLKHMVDVHLYILQKDLGKIECVGGVDGILYM